MDDKEMYRGVEYTIERGVSVDTGKKCWIAKFVSPRDNRTVEREYRTFNLAAICTPYAIDLEIEPFKIAINPPEY